MSIPRCVFYDVCNAFMPYQEHVIKTFLHLAATMSLVLVIFFLIIEFQIMNDFSEVHYIFILVENSYWKQKGLIAISMADDHYGNTSILIEESPLIEAPPNFEATSLLHIDL